MKEIIVAKEAAQSEFDRFADTWDILHDLEEMTPEDRSSFEMSRDRIVREIMSGNVSIEENGAVNYQLKHPFSEEVKNLTIRIPTAEAHMKLDSHKDGQNMHKMAAFIASCTGKAPIIITKLDGRDFKLPLAVASLFLGS